MADPEDNDQSICGIFNPAACVEDVFSYIHGKLGFDKTQELLDKFPGNEPSQEKTTSSERQEAVRDYREKYKQKPKPAAAPPKPR